MFLLLNIKSYVVVTTVVVLLLPLSAVCQSLPLVSEESSGTMEEVIVLGSMPLTQLKREMYRAEEDLYDLFNSNNSDVAFDIRCYEEAPTGSKIKRRVCRPNFVGDLLAEATMNMMLGETYIYPATKIKKMNEQLLANMTETALEQPEMQKALIKFTKARQTFGSERQRRCEGRIFICARQ
jgi:hypothetical protein